MVGLRNGVMSVFGWQLARGPHFDAAEARWRNSAREAEGVVEIDGVEQIESRQLLLGFREGAVGQQRLAVAHPYGGGGGYGLQWLTGDVLPLRAQTLDTGEALLVEVVPFLLGHGLDKAFLVIHQSDILHGALLSLTLALTLTFMSWLAW